MLFSCQREPSRSGTVSTNFRLTFDSFSPSQQKREAFYSSAAIAALLRDRLEYPNADNEIA